jgi:hypothetical protein
MIDTLIQSKLVSILQKCRFQILSEWKAGLEQKEYFREQPLNLKLDESLEILYDGLISAVVNDSITPPLPFKCSFPLDRSHIEFKFLFNAERALMKVLFEMFDFGVGEWMKIRSLVNMAFHRVARIRIDSHCSNCRAAMDEDMWMASRIEHDLKDHLSEK